MGLGIIGCISNEPLFVVCITLLRINLAFWMDVAQHGIRKVDMISLLDRWEWARC